MRLILQVVRVGEDGNGIPPLVTDLGIDSILDGLEFVALDIVAQTLDVVTALTGIHLGQLEELGIAGQQFLARLGLHVELLWLEKETLIGRLKDLCMGRFPARKRSFD